MTLVLNSNLVGLEVDAKGNSKLVTHGNTGDPVADVKIDGKALTKEQQDELKASGAIVDDRRLPHDPRVNPAAIAPDEDEGLEG